MKYIDTNKLIAEIERWRDKAKEKYNEGTYSMGRCDALAEFRNYIVSLQQEQPEVDLEKEIDEYMSCEDNNPFDWDWRDKQACARHFYELGRQAKPEIFDTVAFQKGVQEGRRLEREDALTIADIEKFRREAAKDFTVALVSSGSGLNPKTIAYAIEMADELIKQLKEK